DQRGDEAVRASTQLRLADAVSRWPARHGVAAVADAESDEPAVERTRVFAGRWRWPDVTAGAKRWWSVAAAACARAAAADARSVELADAAASSTWWGRCARRRRRNANAASSPWWGRGRGRRSRW